MEVVDFSKPEELNASKCWRESLCHSSGAVLRHHASELVGSAHCDLLSERRQEVRERGLNCQDDGTKPSTSTSSVSAPRFTLPGPKAQTATSLLWYWPIKCPVCFLPILNPHFLKMFLFLWWNIVLRFSTQEGKIPFWTTCTSINRKQGSHRNNRSLCVVNTSFVITRTATFRHRITVPKGLNMVHFTRSVWKSEKA